MHRTTSIFKSYFWVNIQWELYGITHLKHLEFLERNKNRVRLLRKSETCQACALVLTFPSITGLVNRMTKPSSLEFRRMPRNLLPLDYESRLYAEPIDTHHHRLLLLRL